MIIYIYMGKQKYTEDQINKAIELRKQGMTKPEISKLTGIKIPSLTSLFREKSIYLDDEQKKKAICSRWKEHTTIQNGLKKCNKCLKLLPLENFSKDKNTKDGFSYSCRECHKLLYQQKAEIIKNRISIYRAKNKELIRERNRKYYENNKQKILNKVLKWKNENPEKVAIYTKKFAEKYKKQKVANNAFYRAQKRKATPKWLTKEQLEQIAQFYKNCPEGYHVDHIVPICSDFVCGLHVPWNLQYLPGNENESKGDSITQQDYKVGECYQFKIKKETEEEDRKLGMPFGCSMDDLVFGLEDLSDDHVNFIKRYEWLGTVGYISNPEIYVARHKETGYIAGLVIICTPNAFTKGLEKGHEALIQRGATASWAPKNLGSKLISYACRQSVKNTERRVFVAYSDPEAGEIGTIYQACNFRFLGKKFGTKHNFLMPDGRKVSSRFFRKTSSFKRYAKKLGITWQKSWEKPNGYQDLKAIPKEILEALKQAGIEEMGTCQIVPAIPKGKYALILGRNKKETKELIKKYDKILQSLPYPKRDA